MSEFHSKQKQNEPQASPQCTSNQVSTFNISSPHFASMCDLREHSVEVSQRTQLTQDYFAGNKGLPAH